MLPISYDFAFDWIPADRGRLQRNKWLRILGNELMNRDSIPISIVLMQGKTFAIQQQIEWNLSTEKQYLLE